MSLDKPANIEIPIEGQTLPPLTELVDEPGAPIDINNAISNLPTDTFTLVPSDSVWEKLRVEFWGKNLVSLERELMVNRSDNPIPDDILGGATPPTCFVMQIPKPLRGALRLGSKAIMVRSEYNKAEEAALSFSESSSLFVVTGTPGIGKSVFLLWLLIRRLAKKLPTVVQINSSYPILLHAGGAYKLTDPGEVNTYDALLVPEEQPSHRIWALFDATSVIPQPAGLLRFRSPFFVVQAASPRSQYHEWHKKLSPDYYYMEPWCSSELIQARQLLRNQPTEDQLWYMYKQFGASLGDLASDATTPQKYNSRLLAKIDDIKPPELREIFKNPRSHSASHFLVTLYPLPGDRTNCLVVPASPYVLQVLLEKHLRSRVYDMEEFYDLFRGSTIGGAAAGLIFEGRMHTVLLEKQTLRLYQDP